ncbi:hypothetical protein EYF80_004080 [Liparis tanakae]|uniref:Uncharacterized protein n=1 Tax=Liparis tanakae TaxID=230148 RepID=A0A4Z2J865_9TELE|nr:hypothetical protein EYF80_004080 [Liparis tanakae]
MEGSGKRETPTDRPQQQLHPVSQNHRGPDSTGLQEPFSVSMNRMEEPTWPEHNMHAQGLALTKPKGKERLNGSHTDRQASSGQPGSSKYRLQTLRLSRALFTTAPRVLPTDPKAQ